MAKRQYSQVTPVLASYLIVITVRFFFLNTTMERKRLAIAIYKFKACPRPSEPDLVRSVE